MQPVMKGSRPRICKHVYWTRNLYNLQPYKKEKMNGRKWIVHICVDQRGIWENETISVHNYINLV